MDYKIEIEPTFHSWREDEGVCIIKNFHNLIHCPVGNFSTSPTFSTGKNYEYKWVIDVYASGYNYQQSKYVGIRFYLMNEYEVDLKELVGLRFVASIIDADGKTYSTKSALFENGEAYCAIFTEFALRRDLMENPKVLTNNELCIDFTISSDSPYASVGINPFQYDQSQVLGKVFDAGKYTDFKFIVKGKEFSVHRAVLAARSPVFEAMFDSQMRERNEGKVEIMDVETDVMEKLLRFVYVGELENFENIADEVLVAAEKYQIEELKHFCEKVLFQQLSLDNVYYTLRLADENNAENLKKKSMEFFRRNARKLFADVNFKS